VSIPVNGLTDGAGIAIDESEHIYIADADQHVIFQIRRGGASKIFAGAYGTSGNADGQGGNARFNKPTQMTVDRRGTLWVVDTGNGLIRRVDENANVYTVAQIPAEVSGDEIGGITVDASENIFLIDNTT
jgi:sugar lactone lactonase YvrE